MRVLAVFLVISAAAGAQPVDFSQQIHPILTARCMTCHNGERGQGGLSVMTREALLKGGKGGPALVPGQPAKSPLVLRLKGEGGQRMPLAGPALSAAEIALVERWVAEGAVVNAGNTAKPTFSLKLQPPAAGGIDELMKAYDRQHQIAPIVPVADAVFMRRAYLDLWGLPPTPAELQAFVADRRSNKRGILVDELLANRTNFAEHWVSFWNDLLHNDEGVTYIGERVSITPWLLKSLAENQPYNEFVQALLNPTGKDDPAGFFEGCELARDGECVADAGDAGGAEQRAGLSGHQPEVQFVP